MYFFFFGGINNMFLTEFEDCVMPLVDLVIQFSEQSF